MLKSDYVSENEKAHILTMSIHQAQNDFINHPVTKGAIFILTSVITAGMMQGVAAGSRMLCRNAFKAVAKKALVGSGKFSAKTIGTKAIVSVGYQTITQEGKVNLFTVIGDSFFTPFVGAALGNVFTLNFDIIDSTIEYKCLLSSSIDSKEYIAAVVKTIILGTTGTYCRIGYSLNNEALELGGNLILNTNINALAEGVSKVIVNENK